MALYSLIVLACR